MGKVYPTESKTGVNQTPLLSYPIMHNSAKFIPAQNQINSY